MELQGLRRTRRERAWDATFFEVPIQLRPSTEPVRALVAVSGSFRASWNHSGQQLGWREPLEEALPGLVMIEIGNMLDEDRIPSEPASAAHDLIISIDTYGTFERDAAPDPVIYQFLRSHAYWSWRFGLPVARLTHAEAARLGISLEDLSRLSYRDEGELWDTVEKNTLKPLPKLLRGQEAGGPIVAGETVPVATPEVASPFEVALSFAGEQREFVRGVATTLRAEGVHVFFDEFHEVDLWGRDLASLLGDIYGDRSRYVVIFISKDYLEKPWTEHERQHALSGRIRRMDSSVLPVRLADLSLPGLPDSVAYLDARSLTSDEVADRILQKLRQHEDR